MAYYVVESHVKQHVHEGGKHIGLEGVAALDRAVETIIEKAVLLSSHRGRIAATEIEFAAGVSQLAIKPRGRA